MLVFLTIAIVVLAIIVFGQVFRIIEIRKEIKNSQDGEEDYFQNSDKTNDTQGKLMLVFIICFVAFSLWSYLAWGHHILAPASSVHGADYDNLMSITMAIIIFVFFVTQPILFYFSYKYRGTKNNKATYISHSNKLETIWTIVPAVSLTCLISYGLWNWSEVTDTKRAEDPLVIEVYGKQFNWTARYAGSDNVLGKSSVTKIKGLNELGVDMDDVYAKDDKITKEIHLPINRKVLFKFRSQDIIHSAYMPHFRAQMNCVPGTVTEFMFEPNLTTKDARKTPEIIKQVEGINKFRKEKGEDKYEFDYLILCNKVCGAAHYNMQIKIVVESQYEYQKWIENQQTLEIQLANK